MSNSPIIIITPKSGLIDEQVKVKVSNLKSGKRVIIRAIMDKLYDIEVNAESEAEYEVRTDGCIETDIDRPISGTFLEADSMGFFWSMKLQGMKFPKVTNLEEVTVNPSSIVRFVAEVDGVVVASAECERKYISQEITMTKIKDHGFTGVLFHNPNSPPRPGIIVLGGGEGGLAPARNYAAMLASHGFTTLALAYFKFEDLPDSLYEIPLEYFNSALQWFKQHPDVMEHKIGVFGRSKGAELALLLGSYFREINAVVASSPHPYVFQGVHNDWRQAESKSSWSYQGLPLPFIKFSRYESIIESCLKEGRMIELYLTTLRDQEAEELHKSVIKVENTNGPIMIIGGGDDAFGPQGLYAEVISDRLSLHNFQFEFENLHFPYAGHNIGFSYVPTTQQFFNGGNAKDNNDANKESWTKVKDFFSKHLNGK